MHSKAVTEMVRSVVTKMILSRTSRARTAEKRWSEKLHKAAELALSKEAGLKS